MKRILFLVFTFAIMGTGVHAQTDSVPPKSWKYKGTTSLTFGQSSFSNWASGGQNSVSLNAAANVEATYQKNKITWRNNAILGYGLTVQGSETRKNNDVIDLSSTFGYKAAKYWNYTAQVGLKTQFDKGYKSYPKEDQSFISKFFNPAYLSAAIGMEYHPCDDFTLLLSPASGKFTFVLNDSLSNLGMYGVKPGDKVNSEFGAFVNASYKKNLMENIQLLTKLELFSAYNNEPQNIDVNWTVDLTFKINKYFSATLSTQLLYDNDTKYANSDGTISGAKVQFREVFGIGVTYSF